MKIYSLIFNILLVSVIVFLAVNVLYRANHPVRPAVLSADVTAPPPAAPDPIFSASPLPAQAVSFLPSGFDGSGVLEEAGSMAGSASSYWWLDSGGELFVQNGIASTITGELPKTSKWRMAYALDNAADTDNGYHPQNLFRLVTRQVWSDSSEQVYFRVNRYHLSGSGNRNESNGVLLFNHYEDNNNLYYVGLRVDGTAVIKKKVGGTYYTMAQTPIFAGAYDRNQVPNLLPLDRWIGLKSTINKTGSGEDITLYVDLDGSGNWKKMLTAEDSGRDYEAKIFDSGSGGIRSDFMDVEFKNFLID